MKEGARRFVFEGRECGGHVGPRASFPLWESQIERLLAFDRPEELEILLAGGIHDATSAAMAAAAAAPLAARGAHIGVLMGTAYLFTEEAVAGGAITSRFQSVASGCERTVLLETSPGHATRCVETDYVRTFAERKAELQRAGADSKAMWADLEQLNLGRLRIASKGVERSGDDLVELDDATQAREGMFMIGQVATLRSGVTTIAELHHDVSAGSVDILDDVAARHGAGPGLQPAVAPPLDIAIVGMASIFPGASSTDALWANIVAGANSITEVSPERWDVDRYFDPDGTPGETTPSKWGGFVPEVGFDPFAYGIPPNSLASIEPVQLLSLEVAAQALADAGYAEREFDRDAGLGGVRGRERHRPGRRLRLPGHVPGPGGRPAAGARRLPARAHRGLLPRGPHQRHRRPHRQPPRPRRGQLHRRRRVRLLAGRARRRVQGAAARQQRPGAVRRGRPPQRHRRLPPLLVGPGAVPHRPVQAVRRLRRRHRPGRGHRLRGPQAPRRCRARRRPHLRGARGHRRIERRPPPRAHRAAQGGPAAGRGARPRPGRPPAGHARPGRGARHRHRGRRPHRDGHPHRDLRRVRRVAAVVRARLGEVPDRPHQVRRGPGRASSRRPGRSTTACCPPRSTSPPPTRPTTPRPARSASSTAPTPGLRPTAAPA